QPLGFAVGNALEIKEAILTLQGKGPDDLLELCLRLGSHMVVLAEKATTLKEAREMLQENIKNGKAIETLKTLFQSQGGDETVVIKITLLPTTKNIIEIDAKVTGIVA